MANSVFLDTNGWLALLNTADVMHERARANWLDLGSDHYHVVLTQWIVAETGNGLSRTFAKSHFAEELKCLHSSRNVEILNVSNQLLESSVDLFCQYADKSWGLVDCASFLVMRERGITVAFTSDAHFEQAGFTRLLSS